MKITLSCGIEIETNKYKEKNGWYVELDPKAKWNWSKMKPGTSVVLRVGKKAVRIVSDKLS